MNSFFFCCSTFCFIPAFNRLFSFLVWFLWSAWIEFCVISQRLRMRGGVWTCVCRCTSLCLMQLLCFSHRHSTEHHGRAFRQHCDWRHVSYPALWDLRSTPSCHHLAERWRTHPSLSPLPFLKNNYKVSAPRLHFTSVPLCFTCSGWLFSATLLQCHIDMLYCSDFIRHENDLTCYNYGVCKIIMFSFWNKIALLTPLADYLACSKEKLTSF